MCGEGCRRVWNQAAHAEKASALDAAYPRCSCEVHSLVSADNTAIGAEERLARILTTPGMYDAGQILTQKLTSAWASGVSIIREGSSDAEISETIRQLVEEAAEPQKLLGASVFRAAEIMAIGAPDRHFAVYHTPAPAKERHGDILATTPAGSKNARRKEASARRKAIKDLLQPKIIFEADSQTLLSRLRAAGI